MLISRRFDSVLREPAGAPAGGGDPAGGGPTGGDPAGGVPAGGDPAGGTGGTGGTSDDPPDKGKTHTLTKQQLDERLASARNGELMRLFGSSDRKAIADQWKEFQELKKQQEEAERAKLSEIERYKADIQKLENDNKATAAELDEMRFDAHVLGICAKLGVKNTDYAKFIVAQAADKLPDGEELDAEAWMQEQLEQNEQVKLALGLAAPIETQQRPAGTAPGGQEPPVPPAGGGAPAGGNAFDLTKDQFAQKLAELGVAQGTP